MNTTPFAVLAIFAVIVSLTAPSVAQTSEAPQQASGATDTASEEHERRIEFVEAAAEYDARANYTNVAQGDQPAMTLDQWNTAWNVVVSAYLAAADVVADLSAEMAPYRDAWQAALQAWRDSPEYDAWMQARQDWQQCTRDVSARAARRTCRSELDAKKAAKAAGKELYDARNAALEAYQAALAELDHTELRHWERQRNRLRRVYEAVRCAGGRTGWDWPMAATYFHYLPAGGAGADDVYGYRRNIGDWSDTLAGGIGNNDELGDPGVYVVAEGFKSKYCSDDD